MSEPQKTSAEEVKPTAALPEIPPASPPPVRKVDEIGKTPESRKRYFSMFDDYAIHRMSVHDIAKKHGCSKQQVYLAFQWVQEYAPEISNVVDRLAAIRNKQKNIQEWNFDRAAVRDWLRRQRDGKLTEDERKFRYSYRTLADMDERIAAEEDSMLTLIGVIEKNVLRIQGSVKTEGFDLPAIMRAVAELRPKKQEAPDNAHKLSPTPPPKDSGGPKESPAA